MDCQTTKISGLVGPSDANLNIRPAAINNVHGYYWNVFTNDFSHPLVDQGGLNNTVDFSSNGRAYNYLTSESDDLSGVTRLFPYDEIRDYPTENMEEMDDCDLTTLDQIRIRQHILQIEKFNSAWQKIAADLNHDGKISTLDMIHNQIVILQRFDLSNAIKCAPWYYINDQLVRNTTGFKTKPFKVSIKGFDYPEYLWSADFHDKVINRPFDSEYNGSWSWTHAVKMGNVTEWLFEEDGADCNVNSDKCYNPVSGMEVTCAELKSDLILINPAFNSPNIATGIPENYYNIEIDFSNDLDCFQGFQQAFTFDSSLLELVSVSSDLPGIDTSFWNLNDDGLRTNWFLKDNSPYLHVSANDNLLTLKVKSKQAIPSIEEAYHFTNLGGMETQIIGLDGCSASNINFDVNITQALSPEVSQFHTAINLIDQSIIEVDINENTDIKVLSSMGEILTVPTSFYDT